MTTTKEITYTSQNLQRALAEGSFRDFLEHVKIEESQGNGVGVVPFAMWPHLVEVTKLLGSERLIVWMKARQIGATWLLAAYCVWTAMYRPSSVVLLLSQGELEAQELLRRCKVVWRLLPEHMKAALERRNKKRADAFGDMPRLPEPDITGNGNGNGVN